MDLSVLNKIFDKVFVITLEHDFNDEKFVLATTDYIAVGYQMTGAASPVSNLLTVTVSTLSV